MKRFWTSVDLTEADSGFGISLDGRPVRTPARALLALPTRPLAEAVAEEWRTQGEAIDPRSMPLTGLANAAIDRVAADPTGFAGTLAGYGESDLLYYRADHPRRLVERQRAAWDPLLAWARRRFDVDFSTGSGIIHLPQDEATLAHLRHAVAALDPFRLAALSPLVTISGSLIAALAVIEGAFPVDEVWQAVTVDDRFQMDEWGTDAEAEAALENRRRDVESAARFVSLLA
ncbi:ATPase [Sphingomonas rhizophila]|uniref:ATPase n=1 Tax=Sphingomonas rhizophila TaxID=2071607 RepID=A0A7G9SBF6_9SPHN|nr:ATP12 family protein [Sphingomonas rhizophila]QNN65181.1 ATPase [Sphingomonas rhizophila]